MKTTFSLLVAGIFLAAVNAGFGQSTLQFTASTYTVAESAGSVTLTVQRTNDTNTDGERGLRHRRRHGDQWLEIHGDQRDAGLRRRRNQPDHCGADLEQWLCRGHQDLPVILSNPTNAVLGTRTTATVSITDNDVGLQFQFATYSVAEDAGAVLIGVVRGDDGNLPVTVDFATTDLTATNGLDYTGITNTLSFAADRATQAGPHPDPQRQPEGGRTRPSASP